MSPWFRRSILRKFLIVVSCSLPGCFPMTLAFAQHPVRNAGSAVHIAPPIYRTPASSAPSIHAPLFTPRTSVARSADAFGTAGFRPPRRPTRPFPPGWLFYESPFLFGGPFWGLNSCWMTCDFFWPWTMDYATYSSPGLTNPGPTNYISQEYEAPVYGYGEERLDLPQLFLKDGTILNVTDYWLVDDQLHFTLIDESGAKPAEHVIPFDALDLQTTVDANTRRGFRFMLRNEPVEQYLRDHPDGPPPIVTPPGE
jgi:hypothetical protein